MLLYSEITPKSEDKYVVKVFNWSEVQLSKMTCYKIHILTLHCGVNVKSKGWKELHSLYNIESNPKTESRAERLGRSGLKPTSLLKHLLGSTEGWRFAQR